MDEATLLLCGLTGECPAKKVCRVVSEHEQSVKAGSYEELIEAQHKFDLMERELGGEPAAKADWEGIKRQFPVAAYRNAKEIIRRRMAQERREEAERAQGFWEEATEAGLKGDKRVQWVMGRLGWDPRTDDSRLRRLMGI